MARRGAKFVFCLDQSPGAWFAGPLGANCRSGSYTWPCSAAIFRCLYHASVLIVGCDLLAILLVGSLQNGMPYAESDGQVRARSPAILNIPFIFICLEMPIDEGPIRIQGSGCPTFRNVVVGNGGLPRGSRPPGFHRQFGRSWRSQPRPAGNPRVADGSGGPPQYQ